MPFKGVSFNKASSKWHAALKFEGRHIFVGSYSTEGAAAKSLDRFLYKLHQDHGFTWTEGILQVGLNDEEKAAVDKVTLEELIMVVRQEGAAKMKQNTTSQFRGVYWDSKQKKWRANIFLGGNTKCIGQYENEEEAAKAYDLQAIRRDGRKAILNFDIANYEDEMTAEGIFEGLPCQAEGCGKPKAAVKCRKRGRKKRNESGSESDEGANPVVGKKASRKKAADLKCGPSGDQKEPSSEVPSKPSQHESEEESSEGSFDDNDSDAPVWPLNSTTEVLPWNAPLSPLDIPEEGLDYPEDEDEKQEAFNDAMKDPRFRLYMERRMTKGSIEPNLHIMGQPPFDPWPYVLSPEELEAPKPKPFNKYKAVAHLCPGNFEGLLSDTDKDESECETTTPDETELQDIGPLLTEEELSKAECELKDKVRLFIERTEATLEAVKARTSALLQEAFFSQDL